MKSRNSANQRGMNQRSMSRRGLLQAAIAAGVAPMFIPSSVLGLDGAVPPSKKTTIGFIGVGTHGLGVNLKSFLYEPDAQVAAVCDTFASRRKVAIAETNKKYGTTGCKEYADFRELLADKSLDAICISTPDHWHVPIAMMGLEAGKDVMCEKPTLTIAEGRRLVEAVAAKKAVYQVGIEDRSVIQYHKMAEIVRNGGIGQLKTIGVKLPAGTLVPKEAPIAVPEDLNYKMWSGPVPFEPYTATRTNREVWRQIRIYSGGKLADWGAHLLDTAQVANFAEATGPVEVEGTGDIPKDAMTTMAVNYKLKYRYANGVELNVQSGDVAIKFEGTDGWVGNNGWRGRLESSNEELLRRKFPEEGNKMWVRPPSEHRNFLDCVKSRQPTTYTAEAGQRLSTVMHIGNIAMELGRKLKWDPQTEAFVGDDAANALRERKSFDDWKNA